MGTSTDSYTDVTVNDADNNFFVLQVTNFGYEFWYQKDVKNSYKRWTVAMKKINSTTIRIAWFLVTSTITGLGGTTIVIRNFTSNFSPTKLIEYENIL